MLVIVFLALVVQLINVQEVSHRRYASLSASQLTQTLSVPAVRGGIYDRNGEVLAESVTRQTVVADPFLITRPAAMADALAPVLGVPADVLRAQLTEHSGYVPLAHRVPDAVAAKVTSLNLAGINLVPESQRVVPDGQLASPVVGTVRWDGSGASGLEYQYQSLLAGRAGSKSLMQTPDGVALPGNSTSVAARPGTGVELTMDESVQYVAEQALAAEIAASHAFSGTAVVMDVKTGDILAMADLQATAGSATTGAAPAGAGATTVASTSGPAATAGGAAASTAPPSASTSGPTRVSPVVSLPGGIEEAPSNTAVTQVYEPGSVFKLVTFSAALTAGVITPSQQLQVPAALPMGTYTFHDAEQHPSERLSASTVLAQSSNIGTIEVAQALGKDRLLAQIGNLGFGKATGLNFPGESPGLVPGAAAWTGTSIGSTPIGQDDAVTAQQILDAYNSVANGGILVQPRLVRATVNSLGGGHRGAGLTRPPGDRSRHRRTTGLHAGGRRLLGHRHQRSHRRLHRGRQDRDRPDPRSQSPGVHLRGLRGHVRRVRTGRASGPLGGGGPRPSDAHLRWSGGSTGLLDDHGLRPAPLRHTHHRGGDRLRLECRHRRIRYRLGAVRSNHGRAVDGPGPASPGPFPHPEPLEHPAVQMSTLIPGIGVVGVRGDPATTDVASVEFDSRNVGQGSLFCCVPGEITDGHLYAAEAVERGSTSLLCDHFLDLDVTQVRVAPGRSGRPWPRCRRRSSAIPPPPSPWWVSPGPTARRR